MGLRRDSDKGHSGKCRRVNQREPDVISISDKSKRSPLQVAPALAQRKDIRQGLTGMLLVGQCVDHGNISILGKLYYSSMGKGSGDDAIKPSLEVLGYVVQGLPTPNQGILTIKID